MVLNANKKRIPKVFRKALILIGLVSIALFHCGGRSKISSDSSYEIDLSITPWHIQATDGHEFYKQDYVDTNWKEIRLPTNLRRGDYKDGNVFWLRKSIDLDPGNFSRPIALQIGKVAQNDEVYFNGYLIGRNGRSFPDDSVSPGRKRIYPIPHQILVKGSNTIAIRIQSDFRDLAGITLSPLRINSLRKIETKQLNSASDDFNYAAFSLFAGILFLIQFFYLRDRKYYLHFSLFCLLFSIYEFSRNDFRFFVIDQPEVFQFVEYVTLLNLPYVFLLFTQSFFKKKELPYQKVYLFLNLALSVLFAVFWKPSFWNNILSFWDYHLFVFIGLVIYYTLKSILEHKRDAGLMILALVYFIYSVVKEVLIQRGILDAKSSVDRAFLVLIVLVTFSLRLRFVLQQFSLLNRFKQLQELDTMRERVFNHMNRLVTGPISRMKELLHPLTEVSSKTKKPTLGKEEWTEIDSIQGNLKNTVDDILELSRLEVMAEVPHRDSLGFTNFARVALSDSDISYTIKVNEETQFTNSLDLVHEMIRRIIDFPTLKEPGFHLDLTIMDEKPDKISMRYLLYHQNPKLVTSVYNELSVSPRQTQENPNLIKWAIIQELFRLVGATHTLRLLSGRKKYLLIKIDLKADPSQPTKSSGDRKGIDLDTVKEWVQKAQSIKVPEFNTISSKLKRKK